MVNPEGNLKVVLWWGLGIIMESVTETLNHIIINTL